jgi:S1-C subfamily serine protease
MFWILCITALLSCETEKERRNRSPIQYVQLAANYNSKGLRQSYRSAVKIEVFINGEPLGNGSGNYFSHKGRNFIITSAHVVDGVERILAIKGNNLETIECSTAYVNRSKDIAILIPNREFYTIEPIKYIWEDEVSRGESIYFTSFPSDLSEISTQGTMAGHSAEYYIIQSAAWMGSSGAVLFNRRGHAIGILTGVKVGHSPLGNAQVINNMIMVTPIYFLQQDNLEEILDNEYSQQEDNMND